VIQRQLGHADLGITSAYLRGIDKHRDHPGRSRTPGSDDPRHSEPPHQTLRKDAPGARVGRPASCGKAITPSVGPSTIRASPKQPCALRPTRCQGGRLALRARCESWIGTLGTSP
jgi:hypothetical protein